VIDSLVSIVSCAVCCKRVNQTFQPQDFVGFQPFIKIPKCGLSNILLKFDNKYYSIPKLRIMELQDFHQSWKFEKDHLCVSTSPKARLVENSILIHYCLSCHLLCNNNKECVTLWPCHLY
jgi:hypothetical protein